MALSVEAVLKHSSDLQQARSLGDLMRVTGAAVKALTRYRVAWVAWFDDDGKHVRIPAMTGAHASWESTPVIPRSADAMLEEIATGGHPVVVTDARIDPRTNKEQVARFGNRTLVNIPIILGGRVHGALGTGSFGDEGVVEPTTEELEALVVFGSQLAPAFDRVKALEAQERAEKQNRDLQGHLESLQRVELMGVLAAGVAHDLNNLLAVVLMSLDSIDRSKLGDDADALADATKAIDRMRDVAQQLLQLGRRESGPRATVDLVQKVATTIELVKPSLPPAVTVVQQHEGTPSVDGDAVQLEQALANLVINARDAVGVQGRITLQVDEAVLDPVSASKVRGGRAGRFARVRVSDDGPGIPLALQERVFDPLYTTKPTGTGLGLAVVSRIVEQHHGFLSVDSSPDAGTCFSMYLPAT
ncbi:MAG: ATP-binding protein [Myxococcales bacterium]|nr:ATP-binding protein [Myxococcales bacterium]